MRKLKLSSSRLYVAFTILLLIVCVTPFQNCGKLQLADLKKDDAALVNTTDTGGETAGETGGGTTSGGSSSGGSNSGGTTAGGTSGGTSGSTSGASGSPPGGHDIYDISVSSQEGHVCTPFGSSSGTSEKSGLKAALRYIDPQSALSRDARIGKLATAYFNDDDVNIVKVPQTVYLADVNIPTRHFANGFSLSDGSVLKDTNGQTLVEFFALRMESVLKLSDNEPEGYYWLSTISDDGTVVQVKIDGQWKTIISNDGAHSARMSCVNQDDKILMKRGTRLPVRIYYNQGPATEIANVLLWNYRGSDDPAANDGGVSTATDARRYCGSADQSKFWQPSNSAIGSWGQAVLAAKWKILTPDNFILPNDEVNPCQFSNYDLNPKLEVRDQPSQVLELAIAESAIIHLKLYRVDADGSRTLVKSVDDTAASLAKTFSLENTDVHLKYQLEVIMEIPSKQIQVLKIFNIRFVLRSTM